MAAKLFVYPVSGRRERQRLLRRLRLAAGSLPILDVNVEHCYHVLAHSHKLVGDARLHALLSGQQVDGVRSHVSMQPSFQQQVAELAKPQTHIIEIGPRLNFCTAEGTNIQSACQASGIGGLSRVERSVRYAIVTEQPISDEQHRRLVDALHDRMTQCEYYPQCPAFQPLPVIREPFRVIELLGDRRDALENMHKANKTMGLAFDAQDIQFYMSMFRDRLKRDPTDIELFDLAQSNSEHSRHWFFKGKLVVDGQDIGQSLFGMIMDTQLHSNHNNVIKFCDNSSAIRGFTLPCLTAANQVASPTDTVGQPLAKLEHTRHIIYTAETHNFPTGVCPFEGAATGTGGRLRDVHATGRGAHEIAAVAGYAFGNLLLDGYRLPWEDPSFTYPSNFASPQKICIEASNGASDYGNKFGEPVICGFARSFGQRVSTAAATQRMEYIKPIMFSAGVGMIDDELVDKRPPKKDILVVKLGGPVYRIGVGGGSASSVHVQGGRCDELDFSAVQRGDAEMGHKLHRAVRSCAEMRADNPILSIHDQGAGGNGNVLKEIVESAGAVIDCSKFTLGDPTVNVKELWGAEYQESSAALVHKDGLSVLRGVCARERCPLDVVGVCGDDNQVLLQDFDQADGCGNERAPVQLDLDCALGSVPKKTFHLDSGVSDVQLTELQLPANLTVHEALHRVLRLPSVASKRYLTAKVDRSVTGLVAQQQCVGPCHTPCADVAVTALSYFDTAVPRLPVWLQHLYLVDNHLTELGDQAFRGATHLRTVVFVRNDLQYLHPKSFVGLEHSLETLDLSQNAIDKLPPTVFSRLTVLKNLNLSANRVSDADQLDKLVEQRLQWLSISHNPLVHASPQTRLPATDNLHAAGLDQLQSVSARGFVFDNSSDCEAERCRRLQFPVDYWLKVRSLQLSGCQAAIRADFLERLVYVEKLQLGGNHFPDTNTLDIFERIEQLTHLNLSDSRFGAADGVLSEWQTYPRRLQVLDISGVGLTQLPAQSIPAQNQLQQLYVERNRLSNVLLLERLANLTHLSVSGNQLTAMPSIPPKQVIGSLKYLDVSFNRLRVLGHHALNAYPALRTIDLSHNRIAVTASDTFPIVGDRQIETIDLSYNAIEEMHDLVMPRLLTLNLAHNRLRAFRPPQFFESMLSLRELDLSGNPQLFGGDAVNCTAPDQLLNNFSCYPNWLRMSALSRLQLLNLSDTGMPGLPSHLLQKWPVLKHVDLSHNALTTAVLEGWADDDAIPSCLISISLAHNRLTHLGSLASVLADSACLIHLDLAHNPYLCDCRLYDFKLLLPKELSEEELSEQDRLSLELGFVARLPRQQQHQQQQQHSLDYYCYTHQSHRQLDMHQYLVDVQPCAADDRAGLPDSSAAGAISALLLTAIAFLCAVGVYLAAIRCCFNGRPPTTNIQYFYKPLNRRTGGGSTEQLASAPALV